MFLKRLKKFYQITFVSKTKVTILFLLSLGIPSVFLVFLAIRGIENDQALSEQKLLSEHLIIANSLDIKVEKEITLVEEKLINLFRESSELKALNFIESLAMLDSSVLIDEVFLIREDSLIYPFAKLLYQTEISNFPDRIRAEQMDLLRLINEAEVNEFQLNDYSSAEKLYRSALRRAIDDDTKADLLMRIARVSARRGALARTKKTLTQVINRYGKNKLPGGLPGGLAARLELTSLLLRSENYTAAGEKLYELYAELLKGTWNLNRSQFRFLQDRIEATALEMKVSLEFAGSEINRNIEELGNRADSFVNAGPKLYQVAVENCTTQV